ncbi:MAG: rhodanese-related sulfurtransferase [Okeania sp. SIO2D1]|nr:rhodanese-related sulfurtransferase [Okeania sp. SIO2D1]
MSNQSTYQPIAEVSVEELAKLMSDSSQTLQLIDVREAGEVAIASVEGFTNLPLSEYEAWSNEIKVNFKPEVETLVICHHGMRSAQMCQWLVTQGFTKVKNIAGGIDAYSVVIDSSIPRY